ncbi:MAG: hypothetical protein LBU51_05270 [Bacteroidales bacterium]|jgi:hypothetical protein|nr:hypothetical protein [Bacteroidales bacterium]
MHCLTDYDIKILIAFYESLEGKREYSNFLLENGFAELSALSNAIQSDIDAVYWLINNGFPEFGILSNAIDNEYNAVKWLDDHHCTFLALFAAACRQEEDAIKWFVEKDLKIFIMMIKTIQEILLFQSYDSSNYHKIRKS